MNVAPYFSDPDNDSLGYSASTSDSAIATAAMSNGALSITPLAAGSATVTVTASDGSLSGVQSIPVTVSAPSNSAPVAVGSISAIVLQVGGDAASVNVAPYFSDPDNDSLGYSASTSDSAIATAAMSNGALSITPLAAGSATITVTASDGSLSGVQSIPVTVSAPSNSAPVAVGSISAIVLQVGGDAASVNIAPYFSDPDNDSLGYSASTSDSAIATAAMSNEALSITPLAAGSATITVTASDGSLLATQTIGVTVNPAAAEAVEVHANSAPISSGSIPSQTLSTGDGATSIFLPGYFSDSDGDTLTYTASSSDSGTAAANVLNRTLSIAPLAAGSATVTVTASDASLSTTQTVSVTVTQGNRAPVAVGTIAAQRVTIGGSPVVLSIADNFSDPDGDSLTYFVASTDDSVAVVSASGAVVSITAVSVGTTTATVMASDGDLGASQAIDITVRTKSNGAPVPVGTLDAVNLSAGSDPRSVNVGDAFIDPDGDTLTYTAASADPDVAIVSAAGQAITIEPISAGATNATVMASDGTLAGSQTIRINVSPRGNRAPVPVGAIDPLILAIGGGAIDLNVVSYFSDPDNDALRFDAISSDPNIAEAEVLGTVLTTRPLGLGKTTVAVIATDGGGLSAKQDIAVTIGEANRSPALSSSFNPIALNIGGNAVTVDLATNFSDPDNDALSYTAASSDNAVASVAVSGSILTVTPIGGGNTTISVTASDGKLSASAFIAINVGGEPPSQDNSAPMTVGFIEQITLHVGEGSRTVDMSNYFSDPDGDFLTFLAASANADVALASVSGSIVTVAPVKMGTTSATVMASDGSLAATQTISIAVMPPANQAPVAIGIIGAVKLVVDGLPMSVNVASNFSDPDGDLLSFTAASSDTTTAMVHALGSVVTIVPIAIGSATVTVTASDTRDMTAIQKIAVRVEGNRAPQVAVPINAIELVAGAHSGNIDAANHFADPDDDDLTYYAVSAKPDVATASVAGSIVTIAPHRAGTTSVTVMASDGSLAASQNITVTVIPSTNRAPLPVSVIDNMSLVADEPGRTLNMAAHFSDPDGDRLSFSATSSDTDTLATRVLGTVLTIAPIKVGSSNLTLTASDAGGLSASQTISVQVVRANRAPRATLPVDNITLYVGGDSNAINLARHFTDPDGDALTYTFKLSDREVAAAAVTKSILTIAPLRFGDTVVTVTADDGKLKTSAPIFVIVFPSSIGGNRSPEVESPIEDITVDLGERRNEVDVAPYFSDPDGDALVFFAASVDADIAMASVSGSVVAITPVSVGTTAITVIASDGILTATQAVTIEVTPAPNRAPVAVGTVEGISLTLGGHATTVNVASSFSDPDGDKLIYFAASDNAKVATVTLSRTVVTIKPVAVGTATATVMANDGSLGASHRFTVTVKPMVNRPPVRLSAIPPVTVAEGSNAVRLNVAANFTDPDGESLRYAAVSSDSTTAEVEVLGTEVLIKPLQVGAARVIVTATDSGEQSVSQTVVVRVTASNRPPIVVELIDDIALPIGGEAITLDVSTKFADPDGQALTYTAASDNAGVARMNMAGAVATITPVSVGSTTATIMATDGNLAASQVITITVSAGDNEPPVAVGAIPALSLEVGGNAADVNLATAFDDPDGDILSYSAVSSDTGAVTVNISGSALEATPVDEGAAIITVTAADRFGATAVQTIDVTVTVNTGTNRAPAPAKEIDDVRINLGTPGVALDVSGNFGDPDGDFLSFWAVSADADVVAVDSVGTIVTIAPVGVGSATIIITAYDPPGLSAAQAVTVTVNEPANGAPQIVATIDDVNLNANDNPIALNVALSFSDPEGEALRYEATSSDTSIVATAMLGNVLTIAPISAGTAKVTIAAIDPQGLSASQTITVTVEEAGAEAPEIELLANYPSPFNPDTWIPFRLARDTAVTVTIYNAGGKLVRTFDLGLMSAGAYESKSEAVYWDGRNEFGELVATGVYFYRMSTPTSSVIRKTSIHK